MDNSDWSIHDKPYDLRERLFLRVSHRPGGAVSAQPWTGGHCPFSAVAQEWDVRRGNYEEADDGSSPRDKVAKTKIVLRDLKETNFRLRVLRRSGFLLDAQEPVIIESVELVKIVATIVRKATSDDEQRPRVEARSSQQKTRHR